MMKYSHIKTRLDEYKLHNEFKERLILYDIIENLEVIANELEILDIQDVKYKLFKYTKLLYKFYQNDKNYQR